MQEVTIDQQFIEFIAKNLVDNEAEVRVERLVDERGVLLTLFVNPEDLGRVIGKRGAIAESMRTLLRSLGMKHGAHYNLKIADTDEESSDNRAPQKAFDRPYGVADPNQPTETVENSTEEFTQPTAEPQAEESDFVKNTRQELAELED
ncbi:KH domain-containing protein [Candidatus Saccharibacteria bacterium]|jgi:predicted RNA-binding protein YlqC (UPF0109 family)|nr:KH domain-containing protein [Candidatus Saccharibacteria bacterium]